MTKTNKLIKFELAKVAVNFQKVEILLSEVEKWVNTNKKYQIATPNPEQIVIASKDAQFLKILNKADLSLADGVGLVIGARFLKQDFNIFNRKYQRVSGADFMVKLCQLAAKNNWRIYLLGGIGETAKRTSATIKTKYGVKKVAFSPGTQDISRETDKERKEEIRKINNFKPQLLFVGFGAPWQEKWISNNLPDLSVKVAMSVGGAFDYLSGRLVRAPKIGRKFGLEWLWRLVHQPWRIRRQLRLIEFLYLVIREILCRKP